MTYVNDQYPTVTTKIAEHKRGIPRLEDGKPVNGPVKTYNLSPEELKEYLKTHELPQPKRGRGRPPKMKPEQAQELEKQVDTVNLDEQLKQLEQEVVELSQTNNKLKNLLDDLQDKYNQLTIDYETAEQVKYDLTRTEGQRDQLRASLKETEEILFKEVDKRETLERLAKLYLP